MSTLVAVAAAMLMTLVLPAIGSPAQAAPLPAGSAASQQWAYGAEKWVNVSANFGNATYSVHGFFGWHVIMAATNISTTVVALEAQRTMAASFSAQFCRPNCISPTLFGNLSVQGWQKDVGFANVTTNATVFENGTPVSAFGIVNASARSHGNLSESLLFRTTHANVTHSISASLRVSGHGQASVAFSPSLGLVPWKVTPNATWNASAPFTAQGSWAIDWSAQRMLSSGIYLNASGHPSASVNGSGVLSVTGADLGTATLRNGQSVPVIALVFSGPFDDIDGIILVPHDFDLFGGGHHGYDGNALGAQSASTSKLDFALDSPHHRVHVAASATVFASADQSLTAATPASGPAPASTNPNSPTEVQGQPESVASAQQASQCLVGPCSNGPASPTGALSGAVLPLLLVGLAVIVVVGTVSVVEYRAWARRRANQGLPGSFGQVPTGGLPPALATLGAETGNSPQPPVTGPSPPPPRP